jgi:eukaryotic-like serine/threonine-protein kinase
LTSEPQILFELARGGMGSVHLARVAGLGGFERFVVVKRLHALIAADSQGKERFLSEARLAARIHHANVVGTHHVGCDANGLYMVLDYVEGSSLQGLVDRAALRSTRVGIPVALRIALDALGGLGAVHRATDERGRPLDVVHRDVSLQNILVGRDGIARIADFGIAKGARPAVETKAGSLVGKLLYLPPEYIRQESVDATVDIYMLGVTLWCAITGEEPWAAETEAQLLNRILTERLPSLASRLQEPVAPEIEALVARASHPDPRERFQSADKMAEAIHALDRERGWVANQQEVAAFVEALMGVDLDRLQERIRDATRPLELIPSPSSDPKPDSRSKHRWSTAAVGALGALALGAVFFFAWRSSGDASGNDATSEVAIDVKNEMASLVPPPTVTAANVVAPSDVATNSSITAARTAPIQATTPASGAVGETTRRPPPPTPKKPRLTPPAPPDQISTTNPYR